MTIPRSDQAMTDAGEVDDDLSLRPVVLLLLDGWGVAPSGEANAISLAKTPIFLKLVKEYPAATLGVGALNWNIRYLSLGTGKDVDQEDAQISDTLSTVVSAAGFKQLKITDSERFAALSYFFNGGREDKLPGEEWHIFSGPGRNNKIKNDSRAIVKKLLETLAEDEVPHLTVASLPYLDLVATAVPANGELISRAVEDIDTHLKKIQAAVAALKGWLVISSAGGNAEQIINLRTEQVDNYLTSNPVPFVVIGEGLSGQTINGADAPDSDLSLLTPAGTLADVAPTILALLRLDKPEGMSGRNLLDSI